MLVSVGTAGQLAFLPRTWLFMHLMEWPIGYPYLMRNKFRMFKRSCCVRCFNRVNGVAVCIAIEFVVLQQTGGIITGTRSGLQSPLKSLRRMGSEPDQAKSVL